MMAASVDQAKELVEKITAQGNKVREAKTNNADVATLEKELAELLSLKTQYKDLTGEEYAAPGARKPKAPKAAPKAEEKKSDAQEKGKTKLALSVKKSEDFSQWYSEIITKAELIEYYDVSGCYILRPNAYSIWEYIQSFLDTHFKTLGVQNSYFPMFVSNRALQKEKDHIEDFAPEVAWVTKAGNSMMAEPVAIRPTSETVMYPYFAKWVQSYRDLPIKLNQWCNVVRWEFKHPQPFLRTREFLWQEGHTAHATLAEAEKEVLEILEFYRRAYEDVLAVPVVKGKKSEKEKFAGAYYTTTIEAYIPGSGRAIQAATSHCLGQNFSKMFEIQFDDPNGSVDKCYAWQNSWGFTTRSIGVMIMVHGDDKGIVLPPRAAATQCIVLPCGITAKTTKDEEKALLKCCEDITDMLKKGGVRAAHDLRDNYSPGWKFNHWEQKGIPIRIEIGPRDMASKQIVAVRRDTGEKTILAFDGLATTIAELLNNIHASMFAKAKMELETHTPMIEKWDDFVPNLDAQNLALIPWCEEPACEENIKKNSTRDDADTSGAPAMGAKSLCIPFQQPASAAGKKCIACDKPAKSYTLFGRSY